MNSEDESMDEQNAAAGAPPQSPLTDAQLAELEGALRAAGLDGPPWEWDAHPRNEFKGCARGPDGMAVPTGWNQFGRLIVAAVNAAPSLISEVRRLRARVKELEER
jgi:hypothetical protein